MSFTVLFLRQFAVVYLIKHFRIGNKSNNGWQFSSHMRVKRALGRNMIILYGENILFLSSCYLRFFQIQHKINNIFIQTSLTDIFYLRVGALEVDIIGPDKTDRQRERERERETDRQRQTDRERDRQTERDIKFYLS